MHQKEFRKLLKKYKKRLCTPEEKALVEQWFNSMGSFGNPSLDVSEKSEMKRRSWTRVQEHIAHASQTQTGQHRPLWRINSGTAWAVAAAFLLLMVSALFLIVRSSDAPKIPALAAAQKHISNTSDEVMEVFLKDGSHVLLEPHSKLSFSEEFEGSQRLIALEGEAFFAVSRDTARPFVVATNEVITRVLGTTFSVSAFPNEDNVTIAVMTGKVSVMTRNEKDNTELLEETILTPNQKVIYNKSKKLVSRGIVAEPIPIVPAEVVKRMHFEAAPIKDIFRALEEVYGVEIKFDAQIFSACILTTSIAEGSIYNRLDMICRAIDAEYVLEENHIVITGRGCHE